MRGKTYKYLMYCPTSYYRCGHGLRGYFSDHEIMYVPSNDPDALRSAIVELRESYEDALIKAPCQAQKRLQAAELTTVGYVRRHVDLTLELLEQR